MVMIPNLQEIPLRHSRLPHQPASRDHALGALLVLACGSVTVHCKGRMTALNVLKKCWWVVLNSQRGYRWRMMLSLTDGGEMSGECPVQLANKNLKGTKSFQETTIRNVYSFDWDCIKIITVLTAAEICPMHSLKEHTTTLSDCMFLRFDSI